jgi:hypothetical protein
LILHIYIHFFHCVQPLHFQKFHPLTLFYIFYRYFWV